MASLHQPILTFWRTSIKYGALEHCDLQNPNDFLNINNEIKPSQLISLTPKINLLSQNLRS